MTEKIGEKTRVALVGGGYIAEFHLQSLQALPWVEIIALCDPDLLRARELARKYKIPHVFDHLEALLENHKPDAAHILAPPSLHAELTRTLLEQGVHVFSEKPMGLSVAECEEMHQLAQSKKLQLGVNHSQVFHPGFQDLLALVNSRAIGPIEHVVSVTNLPMRQLALKQYGHWMFREPQNILLESGPHPFSLLLALLGEVRTARTVTSKAKMLGDALPFHQGWHSMLRCARGTASVYMNFGAKYLDSSIKLIGADGTISLDLVHGFIQHFGKSRWPEFEDTRVQANRNARLLKKRGRQSLKNYLLSLFKLKPRSDLFYLSMKNSIQAYHQALHEGATVLQSGREGREVMRYCHMVWSGREPEFYPTVEFHDEAPRNQEGDEVLVLGATGFIGSHLVEALVAQGKRVRVLVRSRGALPAWLNHPAVMVVHGSLTDEEVLGQAIAGCRFVFHLATGLGDSWEETRRIGVESTRRLAELCLEHEVERLIYTSSIAAVYFGDKEVDERVDESLGIDPKPDGRSTYARLKIASEQILDNLHEQEGLPVVTLRPGLVVGSRGRSRVSGTGYWARDNHCIGWNRGDNPLPFVLVEDIVSALLAAQEAPGIEGMHFNLVGPVCLTAQEYIQELGRFGQRNIALHPQSPIWLQGMDVGKWVIKAMIRKPGNQFPSYRDLKTRGLTAHIDCTLAMEKLGWQPEQDRVRFIDKGIRVVLEEEG